MRKFTIKKIIKKWRGVYVLEFNETKVKKEILPNETIRCTNRIFKFYFPHYLKVGDKVEF